MTKQIQVRSTEEALKLALEKVQEFKARWWKVPPFGNKVNKATREAITNAHSPIFELENAIREALAEESSGTEQPAQTDWEAVAADQAMTIALLKAEQPAQRQSLRDVKPLTDEEFLELILRTGTQELVGVVTFVGGSIQMQGKIGLLRSAKIIKEFVEAAHGIKD